MEVAPPFGRICPVVIGIMKCIICVSCEGFGNNDIITKRIRIIICRQPQVFRSRNNFDEDAKSRLDYIV